MVTQHQEVMRNDDYAQSRRGPDHVINVFEVDPEKLEPFLAGWRDGIIDYALGPLGLTEVVAEVDEGNAASAVVIERLGMPAFVTLPGGVGPYRTQPGDTWSQCR